jgi:GT2 family glycosyltransferase
MTKSTLLLPNYNNENVLPLMFRSLRSNVSCDDVNIVVVDDGSEDDGVRVAKEEVIRSGFASAEVISLKHQGVVSALNSGLDAIKTPYVLRIDGDATIETRGWTKTMERWLDQNPMIGLVGAHVLFDSGRIHSFGRSVISEIGLFDIGCIPIEPLGRRTFDSHVIRPQSAFPGGEPYEVDTALGVCAAFRLGDAKEAGGFDPSYDPVWIEDDDFGLSLRLIGKKVIVDPSVQVVHRISLRGSRQPTLGKTSQESTGFHLRPGLSRIACMLPERAKTAIRVMISEGRAEAHSEPSGFSPEVNPWRIMILQRQYKAWKRKWGFDALNPDLAVIYQKYWETQVCWKANPKLYAEGRKQGGLSLMSVPPQVD